METALSIHFLELEVFFFQFLQSLELRGVHTAIFALPVVKGCLVYSILPADLYYSPAGLLFV